MLSDQQRSRARRATVFLMVALLAYGAGIVTGVLGGHASTSVQSVAATSSSGASLLDEAADHIAAGAARPINRATLERAGIDGMLRALGDQWSRYLTPTSYASFRDALAGRYSGVGLWVTTKGGRVLVSSVQPGTPASMAGVLAGDRVVAVDGVAPDSLLDVTTALRGPAGTATTIQVSRDGLKRSFTLVRSPVSTENVTASTLKGDLTVIAVRSFTRGVGAQVADIVAAKHGTQGLVLDLRDNAGGLVSEAVEVASAFLDGGPVVSYERRDATTRSLDAAPGGQTTVPLVVLVNGGTASAAEIVAAALQDRGRAVIVGSRTYGKGSVQEPTVLSDGSALELTVGLYRTPSGRIIDKVGVLPDVQVDPRRPRTVAEQRAVEVVRGLVAATAPSH